MSGKGLSEFIWNGMDGTSKGRGDPRALVHKYGPHEGVLTLNFDL